MKLAIMQPYFFPYLGYFSLIRYSERFILFDTVQFIRHGWIERNRILKPSEGWQYIRLPMVKHARETLIRDCQIDYGTDWALQIERQLEHYKKRAPFYKPVVDLIHQCFSTQEASITKFNRHCLEVVCQYLEIDCRLSILSELDLTLGEIRAPGDWALEISKALNAGEYVNPPGGREIFDRQKFTEAGIDLKFINPRLPRYDQRRDAFENGLSILDVMMFNSPGETKKMIDDFEFAE